MNSFYRNWIGINSITMMVGTASGLIAGKLLAELFFVFVFPFLAIVVAGQYLVLSRYKDWTGEYIKQTSIGFILGSVLAVIQIFALVPIIDLITNHLISLFLILGSTLFFQYRFLTDHEGTEVAQRFVLSTLLSCIIATLLIFLLDIFVDMALDILVISFTNYTSVLPWAISGLILGLSYGIITGNVLKNPMLSE